MNQLFEYSNQSPTLEFKGRDFGAAFVIMPDINNIGLKEFVDKKLSNETSDEKEMIGEAPSCFVA